MSFDLAVRATEILLGWALLQHSLEHLIGQAWERAAFGLRAILAVCLLAGICVPVALLGMCALSLMILHRFQGPYNGGSDRMGILVLWCLTGAHWLPDGVPREAVFGYLGVQVLLSYFVSGWVKLLNRDWRSGSALRDVFAFSAYPVSKSLRHVATWPRGLFVASWAVIVFEVGFPLAVLSSTALVAALCVGAGFHLANALVFGLNRFFWVWLAGYPALIWVQGRIFI